jgi:hypothetical protein
MRDPEPAILEGAQVLSVGMHCGECGVLVPVAPRQLLSALIVGTEIRCPSCDAPYDVWNRTIEQLTFGVFGARYAPVGANVVVAGSRLRRDQATIIDFQKFGIPETAEIEEVNLTPSGSGDGWLAPVFHKDPVVGESANSKPVIYPVPVGEGADETEISILVVWTSQSAAADPAQHALLAGVRAAHRGDHLGAIVSSNVAMELALGSAMHDWLKSHGIGRDRRKQFLASEATYGSQLSVLLPVAAATSGITPMPKSASAALRRLRNLRNDVAHGGIHGATVSDADIAQGLAGAAVGVVYCDTLRAALS